MVHLHAALVPPPDVLEAVLAVVREAAAADPEGDAAGPRRGFLGRRRAVAAPVPAPPALDLVATSELYLPITSYGNVTRGDAERITRALAETCAELERPVVHLSGGIALEPIGDNRVWVRLVAEPGRPEPLRTLTSAVVRSVEQLGFYRDRRAFRPELAVATANDATTEPRLQRVLDALDAFHGPAWTIGTVSLMRLTADGARTQSEEVARCELANG